MTSTFFDKVTGAGGDPAAREPEEEKSANSADSPPAEDEEPSEDEGELAVDVYDKGDAFIIQSTVAGVSPEYLDVSIASDSVAIRGRRERLDEIREERYLAKELFWGNFSRSIILAEEIDEDLAEANLKHGLLTVVLPKKRRAKVQKLKVRVS